MIDERRRLMMVQGEESDGMVKGDILFFLDSKTNAPGATGGFTASASTYYPIVLNKTLTTSSDLYLSCDTDFSLYTYTSGQGWGNVYASCGESGGYVQEDDVPFYLSYTTSKGFHGWGNLGSFTANGDFTWILHLNLAFDGTSISIITQTSGTDYYHSFKITSLGITVRLNGSDTASISGTIPSVIDTIVFIRKNSDVLCYINGSFFGSSSNASTDSITFTYGYVGPYVPGTFGFCMEVGTSPSNGKVGLKFDTCEIYSAIMYDKALTKKEMDSTVQYLVNRYEDDVLGSMPKLSDLSVFPETATASSYQAGTVSTILKNGNSILTGISQNDIAVSGGNCTLDSYNSSTGEITIAYPFNGGNARNISVSISVTDIGFSVFSISQPGGYAGISGSLANACDIVLAKNSDSSLLIVPRDIWSSSMFPSSDFTPVGVVVVPGSHAKLKDGTGTTNQCGIISLKYMSPSSPGSGTTSALLNIPWCGSSKKSTDVSGKSDGLGRTDSITNGLPNYSSDSKYLYYQKSANAAAEKSSSYYNYTPYSGSGYNTGGYSSDYASDSLSDFNGIVNTKILTDDSQKSGSTTWKNISTMNYNTTTANKMYHAACLCARYKTVGTKSFAECTTEELKNGTGFWYLPGCGEMGYVASKFADINSTISSLNSAYGSCATIATSSGSKTTIHYLTSTENEGSYNQVISIASSKASSASLFKYDSYSGSAARAFMRL